MNVDRTLAEACILDPVAEGGPPLTGIRYAPLTTASWGDVLRVYLVIFTKRQTSLGRDAWNCKPAPSTLRRRETVVRRPPRCSQAPDHLAPVELARVPTPLGQPSTWPSRSR